MVDITRPVYGEAWASSGEKLSPTEIKVQSGWVQEMMPYQWENFLQNRQDTTLLYLLQKGVPEWSVDQEYIGNKSIVTYNGYTYQAKSTNTGNLPTNSVYWKRTSPNVTDAGVVTMGSGGTGATNATDARTNLGLGTAATVSADTIVFKSVTGNAPAADKWTSPISLSLSGGATGNTSLDGSGNATINVTGLNASSISLGTVPASALTNATLKTSPTGSTVLAAGSTSERDSSPSEGYARWNKTTKVVEVFNGTSWVVNTSQSEAYVLNRANHNGEQAISTVTGLQTALNLKANLASPQFTGSVVANSSPPSVSISNLAGPSNGYESRAQGSGGTAGAATISLHRPGAHAVHFGLDTDNKLKVGGWSLGANAYAIYHENNKPTKADVGLGNVDNTTDLNKPISTATSNALGLKADAATVNTALNSKLPLSGGVLSGNLTVPSLNGGQLAGMRNKIINGKMEIAQRGTSVSLTASGQYSLDRWTHMWDGSGATRTVFQQSFLAGTGPETIKNFLSYAQSVAGSGGTYNALEQRIEGVGSFAGQQVTLSFYARSNASTPLPNIIFRQNFGSNGSASVDTYLGSNVATTSGFARYTYTLTVPSIVGKTVAGGNDYLSILILLPINSVFTFDITGVQLEVGSVATPFEHRPYGLELMLCQRYYEAALVGLGAYSQLSAPGAAAMNRQSLTVSFATTKRVSPTVALSITAGTVAGTDGGVVNPTPSGFSVFGTPDTDGILSARWTAAAEL